MFPRTSAALFQIWKRKFILHKSSADLIQIQCVVGSCSCWPLSSVKTTQTQFICTHYLVVHTLWLTRDLKASVRCSARPSFTFTTSSSFIAFQNAPSIYYTRAGLQKALMRMLNRTWYLSAVVPSRGALTPTSWLSRARCSSLTQAPWSSVIPPRHLRCSCTASLWHNLH